MIDSKRYLGTDIEDTSSPVSAQDYKYAYDPIGNRDSYQVAQGTATIYTTNNLNQYTATVNPAESFSFDADGNLTQDGTYDYTWNGENRLIAVETSDPTDGDPKAEFTYDSMGRRVRKMSYAWDAANTEWDLVADHVYVYDGWNVVLVLDNADSDATFKTFTWGLDLSLTLQGAGGVGGLLSCDDAADGDIYYYLYDANGNVGQLLDSSGNTDAHYEYEPFGGQIVASGTYAIHNEFRFSTKFLDAESRLYYYGHRYYSPGTGRWLSRDPIGEVAETNLHTFCGNESVSRTDPLGLTTRRSDGWRYIEPPCTWAECVQIRAVLSGGSLLDAMDRRLWSLWLDGTQLAPLTLSWVDFDPSGTNFGLREMRIRNQIRNHMRELGPLGLCGTFRLPDIVLPWEGVNTGASGSLMINNHEMRVIASNVVLEVNCDSRCNCLGPVRASADIRAEAKDDVNFNRGRGPAGYIDVSFAPLTRTRIQDDAVNDCFQAGRRRGARGRDFAINASTEEASSWEWPCP